MEGSVPLSSTREGIGKEGRCGQGERLSGREEGGSYPGWKEEQKDGASNHDQSLKPIDNRTVGRMRSKQKASRKPRSQAERPD